MASQLFGAEATLASTGRHRHRGSKPSFNMAQAIHDGGCFRREGRQEAMASRLKNHGFAAALPWLAGWSQRVENVKVSPGPDRCDPGTL